MEDGIRKVEVQIRVEINDRMEYVRSQWLEISDINRD